MLVCLVGQVPGSTSAGAVSAAAAPPICGSGNPRQSLVGGGKSREELWEVFTARPGTMHITSAPCPELSQMTTPNCKGGWRTQSSHMLERKKKMIQWTASQYLPPSSAAEFHLSTAETRILCFGSEFPGGGKVSKPWIIYMTW